jgi:CRP/FNR family transcriptional regulator, cyclic AMP receptor protein
MAKRDYVHTGLVRLFEADPDLIRRVDPELGERLRRRVLAEALHLQNGPWDPSEHLGDNVLGALVLDGVVTMSVTLNGRRGVELFGQGDIICWQSRDAQESVQFDVSWTIHRPAWLAMLDEDFQVAVARCPEILVELVERVARRHSTAHSRALAQMPALEHRLLVLLWQLADRWGIVQPEGVRLDLGISHTTIGDLVGAQRQSVSRALGRLLATRQLQRDGRSWLLVGAPPAWTPASPPEPTPAPALTA